MSTLAEGVPSSSDLSRGVEASRTTVRGNSAIRVKFPFASAPNVYYIADPGYKHYPAQIITAQEGYLLDTYTHGGQADYGSDPIYYSYPNEAWYEHDGVLYSHSTMQVSDATEEAIEDGQFSVDALVFDDEQGLYLDGFPCYLNNAMKLRNVREFLSRHAPRKADQG